MLRRRLACPRRSAGMVDNRDRVRRNRCLPPAERGSAAGMGMPPPMSRAERRLPTQRLRSGR